MPSFTNVLVIHSGGLSGTALAVSFGPGCLNTQPIASSGPAMNPSRDIVMCQSTAPMALSVSVVVLLEAPTTRKTHRS